MAGKQPENSKQQTLGYEHEIANDESYNCWACWQPQESPFNKLIRVCGGCKDPELQYIHEKCISKYIVMQLYSKYGIPYLDESEVKSFPYIRQVVVQEVMRRAAMPYFASKEMSNGDTASNNRNRNLIITDKRMNDNYKDMIEKDAKIHWPIFKCNRCMDSYTIKLDRLSLRQDIAFVMTDRSFVYLGVILVVDVTILVLYYLMFLWNVEEISKSLKESVKNNQSDGWVIEYLAECEVKSLVGMAVFLMLFTLGITLFICGIGYLFYKNYFRLTVMPFTAISHSADTLATTSTSITNGKEIILYNDLNLKTIVR